MYSRNTRQFCGLVSVSAAIHGDSVTQSRSFQDPCLRQRTTRVELAAMACLQSYDRLHDGLPASKSSSNSLRDDCKDEKARRQQETTSPQYEDLGEVTEPVLPAPNHRHMWVEQQGNSCRHRTFIAAGERYEMVSCVSRGRVTFRHSNA